MYSPMMLLKNAKDDSAVSFISACRRVSMTLRQVARETDSAVGKFPHPSFEGEHRAVALPDPSKSAMHRAEQLWEETRQAMPQVQRQAARPCRSQARSSLLQDVTSMKLLRRQLLKARLASSRETDGFLGAVLRIAEQVRIVVWELGVSTYAPLVFHRSRRGGCEIT
jgi:hypothetical protein